MQAREGGSRPGRREGARGRGRSRTSAAQLEQIEARYQPRFETRIDELAGLLSAWLAGGILLSRVVRDLRAVGKQILH